MPLVQLLNFSIIPNYQVPKDIFIEKGQMFVLNNPVYPIGRVKVGNVARLHHGTEYPVRQNFLHDDLRF